MAFAGKAERDVHEVRMAREPSGWRLDLHGRQVVIEEVSR
jgi:hypothetical protein